MEDSGSRKCLSVREQDRARQLGKGVGKPERQGSFKTIGAEKWGKSKTEQA